MQKMILSLIKCKKILLMNNNNTKEKEILPLLQLESLVFETSPVFSNYLRGLN